MAYILLEEWMNTKAEWLLMPFNDGDALMTLEGKAY